MEPWGGEFKINPYLRCLCPQIICSFSWLVYYCCGVALTGFLRPYLLTDKCYRWNETLEIVALLEEHGSFWRKLLRMLNNTKAILIVEITRRLVLSVDHSTRNAGKDHDVFSLSTGALTNMQIQNISVSNWATVFISHLIKKGRSSLENHTHDLVLV